jgi:hypothetical protein
MKPTEKERNSFINNGTAHLNDVANFNPRSTTTKVQRTNGSKNQPTKSIVKDPLPNKTDAVKAADSVKPVLPAPNVSAPAAPVVDKSQTSAFPKPNTSPSGYLSSHGPLIIGLPLVFGFSGFGVSYGLLKKDLALSIGVGVVSAIAGFGLAYVIKPSKNTTATPNKANAPGVSSPTVENIDDEILKLADNLYKRFNNNQVQPAADITENKAKLAKLDYDGKKYLFDVFSFIDKLPAPGSVSVKTEMEAMAKMEPLMDQLMNSIKSKGYKDESAKKATAEFGIDFVLPMAVSSVYAYPNSTPAAK